MMDAKYHNITSKRKDVYVLADLVCRNVTFGLIMVNCSSSCSRKWVRRDCVSLFFDSQQIVCVPALIELAMLHFPWSSVLSWPRDGWSSTQRSECASKCAQCWSDNGPSYNHKLPFALVRVVTCDVVKWTKGALLMRSFDPVLQ